MSAFWWWLNISRGKLTFVYFWENTPNKIEKIAMSPPVKSMAGEDSGREGII